jgi:hypothetical protein
MIKHLVIALALAATPAVAQEKLDLLATTVAGVVDGADVAVGPNTAGPATRTAAGSYTVATAEGEAALVVTEPTECLFEVALTQGGAVVASLRFDFNLVSGVSYEAADPMQGLNQYRITLGGEGDLVHFQSPGGEFTPAGSSSSIATSLTAAELQAAADALEAACPKP